MAEEEGGDGQVYKFVTESGEVKKMSRDYTGKATATYPNKDCYTGDYKEGIRTGSGTYLYFATGDSYEGMWN